MPCSVKAARWRGNYGQRKDLTPHQQQAGGTCWRTGAARTRVFWSRSVSAILAASEQRLDLIVIAEERDKQFRRPVLKNETQRNITPTLEDLVA